MGSDADPVYSPTRSMISQKKKIVKLSLKAAKSGERAKRQGELSVVSKTLLNY